LLKNKEELVSVARELYDQLKMRWNVSWDASSVVGRRYRRADGVGTPFCIPVSFDTIEKNAGVTIRDRDTTQSKLDCQWIKLSHSSANRSMDTKPCTVFGYFELFIMDYMGSNTISNPQLNF
jgi:glycyl-tRNA synthetase (class II)